MLKPILRTNLDLLFVGFNPHPYSWERGRYYAHGSLWRIVRKAGLAEIYDDTQLLDYNFGITDLVHDKPTKEAHEITDEEYAASVIVFRKQLARLKPCVVCLTGKGVFRHFVGLNSGAKIDYGLAGRFKNSFVYVVPFPSHKWMTDAAKVEHYKGLLPLLEMCRAGANEKDCLNQI